MKIIITNQNEDHITEISDIQNIKFCDDGRMLIDYYKKKELYTWQIPKGYIIKEFIIERPTHDEILKFLN